MTPEKILQEVIKLLETETQDISLDDYIETLEQVLNDVESKLDAAKGDKRMQKD